MNDVEYKPIDILNNAGFEAYFVGGCVRDTFMCRKVSDIDITTNAMPNQIQDVFSEYRTLDVGIKHGTITVLMHEKPYEITTYRSETEYRDHRHPNKVHFGVSLKEDLARRDFTVNAIAWDGKDVYFDPFGGIQDIQRKVIRCVGDPMERFDEDALRILRALRFSATLGFEIDEKTVAAMRCRKELLCYISAERIWQEISKMIVGENAVKVLLQFSDILEVIFPEFSLMRGFDQKNYHHIYDVWTHTVVALGTSREDLVLRMAILLHDCGKPFTFSLDDDGVGHFYGHAAKSAEIAERRLEQLRVDNKTKNRIVRLIAHHDSPAETELGQVVRKMRKLESDYPLLVALRRADNLAQAPQFHRTKLHDRCEELYQYAVLEDEEKLGRKLSVSGHDLLQCGAIPGKNIGDLLRMLADDVLDKKVENEKQELLEYAIKNYSMCFGGACE